MVLRSDIQAISGIIALFVFLLIGFNMIERGATSKVSNIITSHAVMIIKTDDSNKSYWDHLVHKSIPQLNAICNIEQANTSKSSRYPHKSNSIFLIHAHEERGKYLFHIPESLGFDVFSEKAYQFFSEMGLEVSFHRIFMFKQPQSATQS